MSKHMDVSVKKANKVLGLLKSTSHSKNREIFSVLYSLSLSISKANWPLKEHQELPLGKHIVRFLMIRDANYWAGARLVSKRIFPFGRMLQYSI